MEIETLSAKVLRWFTWQPPTGDQAERYKRITAKSLELAQTIAALTPSTPEQTLALRACQEARMWANAAIATNPGAIPPPLDESAMIPVQTRRPGEASG